MSTEDFRCGRVALVGRPNVGKSTLLNAMMGLHLSIVSPKPQTTRHRILGIVTRDAGQILYLDTPGLHQGARKAMNRNLNRAAHAALAEADVLIQVIEAERWTEEDEAVFAALSTAAQPRLLAVNKVDRVRDKPRLLPFIENLVAEHAFDEVHYVSALRRNGLSVLENAVLARLPCRPAEFDEDALTDRSERFLVAERVREQLMLRLQDELPYATTVEVESFKDRADGSSEVHAVIWVEREGQKGIVVGRGGAVLRDVGTAARRNVERLLDRRIHLKLWVKVRENWSDDDASLRRFGLDG